MKQVIVKAVVPVTMLLMKQKKSHELKQVDAQDALEVLKKAMNILGKSTEAVLEVAEMAETAHKAKRQVSVSGMLKHLDILVLVIMHR